MTEKIRVSEAASTTKRLIGILVSLGVPAAVFLAMVPLEPMVPYSLRIYVLGAFFAMSAVVFVAGIWWARRGRKVEVTPILKVEEDLRVKPESPVADAAAKSVIGVLNPPKSLAEGVAGVAAEALMDKASWNRFMLCEEGVVIGHVAGAVLYPWKRIRWYRAKPKDRSFEINVRGILGSFSFATLHSFDEANRIMSERSKAK